MTTKKTLLEQFTACYDENGWFVTLKNAVKNLRAEQAIWKTENLDNSIWEILSHLNFSARSVFEAIQGIAVDYSGIENEETFSSAETILEEAW